MYSESIIKIHDVSLVNTKQCKYLGYGYGIAYLVLKVGKLNIEWTALGDVLPTIANYCKINTLKSSTYIHKQTL